MMSGFDYFKDIPNMDLDLTPRMILAGADALAGFNHDLDSAFKTVAEIYRAMGTARTLIVVVDNVLAQK